jgi:hypothetical protein
LFPITLGVWWPYRDRLSGGRIAALSALLTLGYFCHLVSLGLTVLGLIVLSVLDASSVSGDSWRYRLGRLARTSLSFIPLVVLGFLYLRIARQGGPMHPVWDNLSNPWAPTAWAARLGWADPLTLAIKDGLPFTERVSRAFALFAPAAWLGVALVFWWYGRISYRPVVLGGRPGFDDIDPPGSGCLEHVTARNGQQAWLALSALLVAGGILGPDSLGTAHGEFLPQRVILLGLVAFVPVIDVNPARLPGWITTLALVAALVLQTAIVWDYARYSDRTAGQIIRAGELVGRNQRIVTQLTTSRGRFRANPLLHAENWLGVDTCNVVWNNYETLHYYFPVQFKPGIARPHPGDLELVSIHEDPNEQDDRVRDWERILYRSANSIDMVLVWKSNEGLDAITQRWFEPAGRRGDVQVFRRAQGPSR